MTEPGRPFFPIPSSGASETWQVGTVRPPIWLRPKAGGRPARVVAAACLNVGSMKSLTAAPGTLEELRDNLEELLTRAAWKWRSRPARIQVSDPALAGLLAGLLGSHGVRLETVTDLSPLDGMLEDILESTSPDDPRPSPLTGGGVTVERLSAFARAAAAFCASSCWRHLTSDDRIRVEAPEAETACRYFVLTREAGRPTGLVFFAETEDFDLLCDGEPEDLALGPGFWHIGFDPPWEAPTADLELWERFDLPWCSEDRCPVASLPSEVSFERPDRRRLAFFEGLLAALAATSEEEIDAGRWEKRVTASDGRMDFVLSLPGLTEPEEAPRARPAFTWTATERPLRDLGKLLRGREWESMEEINQFLAGSLSEGELPHSEPETPRERAEELIDLAWETPGRRAVHLARQALEIWPDCADAYNFLAGRAADPESARELFERALAAGERALGPEIFVEEAGHFWGILETRPYMRARQGLAEALVDQQRFAAAAEHFQELLRLNPNDNQGVRDSLVNVLLAADRDAEAEELLERFAGEASALLLYPGALLRFRREGDSFTARRCLKNALRANQLVPGFLLGKRILTSPPDTYSPGSEDEAALYVVLSCETWQHTPGALDWLRRQTALPPKPGTGGRRHEKRRKKKRR